MPTRTLEIPLEGGLNLDLAHSRKPPGFTLYQHNFESVFGRQGYRRIGGYQAFDGRRPVQDVGYGLLTITDETTTINIGDAIDKGGASVAHVVGRNGAELVVTQSPDTPLWVAGDTVRVGATAAATVVSYIIGNATYADYPTNILLAQAHQRALVTDPGATVTGMVFWNGSVYAGQDDGTVKRTTSTGWVSAVTNLIANGTSRFVRHNFGGSDETDGIFCADGRNRPWRYDPVGGLELCPPMVQTNATSATSATIGAGSVTFTVTEDNREWAAGQLVRIWSNADRTQFMQGDVTAWDSGAKAVTVNVTVTAGGGTFDSWEIGLADFSDKPYDLVPFGTRMVYAFPNGQVLLSDVGEPFTFTTTSLLVGVGDEITGLVPVKGGPLAIFCDSSIHLLSGETVSDIRVQIHSRDTGAKRFTAVGVGGNAVFVSERGVTSLAASDAYGDFQLGLSSGVVQPLVPDVLAKIAFVSLHKTKMQYRMYLSDGTGLCMTFLQESGILGVGPVAFSTFGYPNAMTCGASGVVAADESHFISDGTTVYQEDVGANFNGASIYAYLMTAFGAYGNSQYKKRFRKLAFEIDAPVATSFNFRTQFDGADRYYQPGDAREATAQMGGGLFDGSAWNTFAWSGQLVGDAPFNISGVGRTMSVIVWKDSDVTEPYSIQGVSVHFSPLGIQR